MSKIQTVRPIKIGITGQNYSDGMGDLAHILNVGKALYREGVTNVTYHIHWSLVELTPNKHISESPIDHSRLNQLIDKLKYENIIPKNTQITGDSINNFIDNINNSTNGKFEIIARDIDKKIHSESQDLWISVSSGGFPGIHTEKYLDYVKFIAINEHNSNNPLAGYGDKTYKMGTHVGKVGIILKDNVDRNIKDRVEALNKINNTKFKTLVQSENEDSSLEEIITKTEFIPAYIQHVQNFASHKLIIECISKVKEKEIIFIKLGSYNLENFLNNEFNLKELKNCGIKKIQYLNNDIIKNIELPFNEGSNKVLKILTKCHLNEDENIEFQNLTGSFSICSGDNTLQDAISNGSIPLFIPHMKGKEDVLSNLSFFLNQNNFPNSAKYVSAYNKKELFWPAKAEFKNHKINEVCTYITDDLIKEWPNACKKIIKNFSLNSLLSKYVDRLGSISPEEFRTPGDLLAKYLDEASDNDTIVTTDPILTEYDLRTIKQPIILTETEIIEALKKGHEINGDLAIEYANYYQMLLDGKSPIQYAIDNNIKINGENAVMYGQEQIITSPEFFYILDPKDNEQKSPLQYAIDNNIKIDRKKLDPVIFAIENGIFFKYNEVELDTQSQLIKYSLIKRTIEENQKLIQYSIKNEIEIDDELPSNYFYKTENNFYITKEAYLLEQNKISDSTQYESLNVTQHEEIAPIQLIGEEISSINEEI